MGEARLRLTVTRAFAVAELGTIVFVDADALALECGTQHRVMITRPDGESVETVASVESIRNEVSREEFTALLFASLTLREVVMGSSISILAQIDGG